MLRIDAEWCTILNIIQKLYGSFKGDAFNKRVLPFFHACAVLYVLTKVTVDIVADAAIVARVLDSEL